MAETDDAELIEITFDSPLRVRSITDRIISGVIAPFGSAAEYAPGRREQFMPGCIDTTQRPLLRRGHDQLIGIAVELREEADGVHGDFRVSETAAGDETLALAADGALHSFSAGFYERRNGSGPDGLILRERIHLDHIGITERPVHPGAAVQHIRETTTEEGHMPDTETTPEVEVTEPAIDNTVIELREQIETLSRQLATVPASPIDNRELQLRELPITSLGELIHFRSLVMTHEAGRSSVDPTAVAVAQSRLDQLDSVMQQRQAASTETGDLGGAIPSNFLGPIVDLVRSGRPYVNALGALALPTAGMDVHRPITTQGSTMAWEASEGDEPASTAYETTDTTVAIKALKGRNRLTLQAATRSQPNAVDALLRDMAGAFAATLEAAVINGTGDPSSSLGAHEGVLQMSGIGTVVVADTLAVSIVEALAEAIGIVWEASNQAPLFWTLHPRRWAAWQGLTDTTGRPLFVHPTGFPQNVAGSGAIDGSGSPLGGPAGVAGLLMGYPVVISSAIPTDLGLGGDEDTVMLNGVNAVEFYEDSNAMISLQSPDDFQTTWGLAGMSALVPVRTGALVAIGGPGLIG